MTETDDTVHFGDALREQPLIKTDVEAPDGETYELWWKDTSVGELQDLENAIEDDPDTDLVDSILDEYLVRDAGGNELDADDFEGDVWAAAAFKAFLHDALGLTDDVIQEAIAEHEEALDEGNR